MAQWRGFSLFSIHLCHCFLLLGWTPHTLPLQGNFSGTWSTSCPSFCTDCLQGCFSPILPFLPVAAVVQQLFPLLSWAFYQRQPHLCWWAQPWPAVGQPWSWLVLASLDMGEASRSLSQKPPLWSPSTKTVPHKGNTPYVSLAFKRYRSSFFWQIDQRLPLKRMGSSD